MKTIFTNKTLLLGAGVTLIYLTLSIYLINYRIILYTITNSTSFTEKAQLLLSLSKGSLKILPLYEILIITFTAFLVGINTVFVVKLFRRMKNLGKIKLTTGGSSLLALMGAGCPNCGISVLSVLGISSSVIPIPGLLLQAITLLLLIGSLIYNFHKLREPVTCKIQAN